MEKGSEYKRKLALLISWTIHPIPSFVIVNASIMYYLDLTAGEMVKVFAPFYLITIFYIIISVFVLHHADIEFTNVKKRPPLFIAMILGLVVSLIIAKSHVPAIDPFITRLMVILIIAATITFYWKISIHALFSTMAIIMLIQTVSMWYVLLFALLPGLYWSRIYLHKHKYWQLVAGSLLSLVLLF